MHCKAFGLSENFDMHTLKQVYLYVICVDLYGMNQIQNLCIALEFSKTLIFSI